MPDAAWKAFERRVAAVFGAQRRGAHTGKGKRGKGLPDLIAPGWSIECKLYSKPDYDTLLEACRQAERNQEKIQDIPVAVVKRLGGRDDNALVVMRLETFSQWFINLPEASDEDHADLPEMR